MYRYNLAQNYIHVTCPAVLVSASFPECFVPPIQPSSSIIYTGLRLVFWGKQIGNDWHYNRVLLDVILSHTRMRVYK